jgi:hypothetical protein
MPSTEALFTAARGLLREALESPQAQGAHVATPEPAIPGYWAGSTPVVVPWVVENDRRALRGDLFAAMRRTQDSTSTFIVPVMSHGRLISEFVMQREASGWTWAVTIDRSGERTSDTLVQRLGAGTEVRRALFLPSGLVFEVGRNGTRQALRLVTFFNWGAGITGFDGYLPWDRVLTPQDVQRILVEERTTPHVQAPDTVS